MAKGRLQMKKRENVGTFRTWADPSPQHGNPRFVRIFWVYFAFNPVFLEFFPGMSFK